MSSETFNAFRVTEDDSGNYARNIIKRNIEDK